jgi:hypothetical protein
MPAKLDILEPGCCCVRRAPVYPEVYLMENSIIAYILSLLSVFLAHNADTPSTLLACFASGYGVVLVVYSYRDVQKSYYERLEREEIETDGFSEASETAEKRDATTETSSEEGDDAKSEYSDVGSQVNFDDAASPLRRRRVIKIKKTAAAALDVSQEDRVLQQLRQIEKEVAERNAARESEAAIIVAAREAYKATINEKKD